MIENNIHRHMLTGVENFYASRGFACRSTLRRLKLSLITEDLKKYVEKVVAKADLADFRRSNPGE